MLRLEDFSNDELVYALNKLKSAFLVTAYRVDGKSELITVPHTFIPVCLSDFVETSVLKSSSDMRKAISKGYLELIRSGEAHKLLETSDATIELNRLRNTENFNINVDREVPVTPLEALKDLDSNDVRVSIKDALLRTDLTDTDSMAKLNSDNRMEPFSIKELEFIVVSSNSKPEVYEWASDKLKALKEGLFNTPAN